MLFKLRKRSCVTLNLTLRKSRDARRGSFTRREGQSVGESLLRHQLLFCRTSGCRCSSPFKQTLIPLANTTTLKAESPRLRNLRRQADQRSRISYSAFLPALLALAQRAFMRWEMLLRPASLIWPRLRGPVDEARCVRPPVRASIAATTRSRCWLSSSIMLGVSMELNYKTSRILRTRLRLKDTAEI
jgi:hypothetical protein